MAYCRRNLSAILAAHNLGAISAQFERMESIPVVECFHIELCVLVEHAERDDKGLRLPSMRERVLHVLAGGRRRLHTC